MDTTNTPEPIINQPRDDRACSDLSEIQWGEAFAIEKEGLFQRLIQFISN